MEIVRKIADLQQKIAEAKNCGKKVGLVPTMGALHEGHLTLVRKCKEENDLCVVSVFVNPTQFNNVEDLEKYPRTPEEDSKLLESVGCDMVFMPEAEEVYPEPDTRIFDLGDIDKVMEGKMRPGHFNGVCQVVSKLFDFVKPHNSYFGEKDFQQVAVIKAMVNQLGLDLNIIQVPIVREESGLAMSSRNMRLSTTEKEDAVAISNALFESKKIMNQMTLSQVRDWVIEKINKVESLDVEYFDIVDGDTMQEVKNWDDSQYIVGCITVYCGKVRLIDNIIYKNK